MGLSVEEEVQCPKFGYSIDMLVHNKDLGMGGEGSSSGGTWAVEFDGPYHFLASGAPTGNTLLKRQQLLGLGHALVSVPYWEWEKYKTVDERMQYLRGKLESDQSGSSTGDSKQEPQGSAGAHRELQWCNRPKSTKAPMPIGLKAAQLPPPQDPQPSSATAPPRAAAGVAIAASVTSITLQTHTPNKANVPTKQGERVCVVYWYSI
jgi:hypothetical protein